VRGDPEVQKRVFDQWNTNGTGPLATNGIEAGVKVRPTEDELNMMDSWPCPEFRSGWDNYFKEKPDKPVMYVIAVRSWFVSFADVWFLGTTLLFLAGSATTCSCLLASSSRCSIS